MGLLKKMWTVVSKDKKRVKVSDQDGNVKTLMTPTGKCGKFKHEMKTGKQFTNEGKPKLNKKGEQKRLTDVQRAYRSGYVAALGEQAAIYNKKHGKKK